MRRTAQAAVATALTMFLAATSGAGADLPGPAAGSAAGPDTGVAAVIARYQEKIPEVMAEQDVPGLALAVVDGDRVLWQQGFGSTERDDGTPVTVDTLFSVQSMTKTFTSTAVMQAVQAGLVDLDEPITTYLPDFTVHSAFEPHPERRMTLRTLLGCTAGFTHEAPLGNNFEPEPPGTFDAHVRSISETWLRFPVGTGYAYSNLGFDLAGAILERVYGKPYPALMRDTLLGPLGMEDSTFDRGRVHATANRAVGDTDELVAPPVDVPMMGAGGLWSSAADLARFLELQLGNGTFRGRTLLDPALVREMRTVPDPHQGAPAGYALGVARTRWRVGAYPDLFDHGGGGFGFLSDLWWVPQLQLGIAVLTNSDQHELQGSLALGILRDLVTEPGSIYARRMQDLPTQPDVFEPDSKFVPPTGLFDRISALALPPTDRQAERWDGYPATYRVGRPGAMDPSDPPSRFHVESGAAYFDVAENGTTVSHRLTEFRPGLFLAENGETLDLRSASPRWRGVDLNPVTDGPLVRQWVVLLGVVVAVAGWVLAGWAAWWRRRRSAGLPPPTGEPPTGQAGRAATRTVATVGALAGLACVTVIWLVPGLVDVGFLGAVETPLPMRLAFHLPLALALLAAGLVALLVAGAVLRWWTRPVRARDAVLAVALGALTLQLASWHLVAWGF